MPKIEIVAEIGISHNGDMGLLKEMILSAKCCGCDIIKTQLYDPIKLFPNKEVWINGRNWYPEVERTRLTKRQFLQFVEWCKEVEAEPMASAFDLTRLSWLEEIGVRRHKIASRMNQDRKYLEAVSKTGKEILLSCQDNYYSPCSLPLNTKLIYCIPHYPTPLAELKLKSIDFTKYSGFSSHYPGIEPAIFAIARGARIIEVHFCLSRAADGPDIASSVEPQELRELVKFAKMSEAMC